MGKLYSMWIFSLKIVKISSSCLLQDLLLKDIVYVENLKLTKILKMKVKNFKNKKCEKVWKNGQIQNQYTKLMFL